MAALSDVGNRPAAHGLASRPALSAQLPPGLTGRRVASTSPRWWWADRDRNKLAGHEVLTRDGRSSVGIRTRRPGRARGGVAGGEGSFRPHRPVRLSATRLAAWRPGGGP